MACFALSKWTYGDVEAAALVIKYENPPTTQSLVVIYFSKNRYRAIAAFLQTTTRPVDYLLASFVRVALLTENVVCIFTDYSFTLLHDNVSLL